MTAPASAEDVFVLVDGSSYLYRAFHAMPELSNAEGEPTGAVYGVINMLRTLLREYPETRVVVVFDAPGENFRHRLFADYKANRPAMPDELRPQIAPLKAIVEAMGLPLLVVDDVEADDVIGTLARQASRAGHEVIVSTGDKDMAQLVDERVRLINTMTGERLDAESVEAKFGVRPEQIVDFLALTGDSSDNIPGIPGVGPKTAAKWLQRYRDIDGIVAHADEIGGKIGERLRAHLEQLPLSRRLATIRCDLEGLPPLDALRRAEADTGALEALYRRLGFRRWLAELSAGSGDDPEGSRTARERDYETVLDEAALARWVERIGEAAVVAIDTETTSLDTLEAEIVGVSLAVAEDEACYIPCGHDYPGAPEQLERAAVLDALRGFLEDEAVVKVAQNLKYDLSVFREAGIALRGVRYDTMLESYVLDSTAGNHDMDSLARRYLDLDVTAYEAVAGKGAKQRGFDEVPLEEAAPYAAEDADITWRLHATLWPRLEVLPALRRVFEEIEMPLVPILADMERHGVLIDGELLRRHGRELERRLEAIERQCAEEAGTPFNLASPRQIQEVLYERLGLPVRKRTPKGQPSTAESVLAELAEDYALPRLILEHRSLNKLKSTYTDRLPEQIHPRTGRVHTSYHQAVTATGRLSSSQPNLQNIPVRTAEGRRIRQAFIAPPGWRLVAADYSQIELRILAHLSGDEALCEAFRNGEDIHRATAAEIFGSPLEAVTPEQRRSAKAINFGLIYGMSAFGLARQLEIGRQAAEDYMAIYFERYPGVKRFMDETRETAREQGYVETLYGRRLHLPDIRARNGQRRQYAERAAINAPMQGTAADIIKRAMRSCHEAIVGDAGDITLIMQVHDELVFEVREDAVATRVETIREAMESAADLIVPLVVDIGVGDNWDEAH